MTAQAGKAPLPAITMLNGTRLHKRMRSRMTIHRKCYITGLHLIIDVYP